MSDNYLARYQTMKGKGGIQVAIDAVDGGSCQIALIDDDQEFLPTFARRSLHPFFTTKSRGSGLGLPTAKRLIEAHNGQIVVECPPAGGTQVVIRLPTGTA